MDVSKMSTDDIMKRLAELEKQEKQIATPAPKSVPQTKQGAVTPGNYATPAQDTEIVFFTLKSNPAIHLAAPNLRQGAFTYGGCLEDAWFTAYLQPDKSYVLRFGQRPAWKNFRDPKFEMNLVLDQYLENSNIHAHPSHGGSNQHWAFIPAGDGYYRILNVGRKEYLTYNPGDKRVYGYIYYDTNNQLWQKH